MDVITIDKTDETNPLAFSSNHPLEQFILLAKGTKGGACAELIKQVLDAPGVYVFGELLEMQNIMELESGSYDAHFKTLNLFAYGTYKDYLKNTSQYIELTPVQHKKLQHLTIVTLATQEKCIPYSKLLEELNIKNVRDLEDLIIEAIYADIIHAKLDQKRSLAEVEWWVGRDARKEEAASVAAALADWCAACDAVLAAVDQQVQQANADRQKALHHAAAVQHEIINIKKTLKSQSDNVEGGSSGSVGGAGAAGGGSGHGHAHTHTDERKKGQGKAKTPRNAKFWQKTA